MQDYIYIYDSAGNVAATVREVIDAEFSDRLSGEMTLSFITKFDRLPDISKESEIRFKNQYFKIRQMKISSSENQFLCEISAEQISISLVDEEINKFSTPKNLDEIKTLLKTEITKFENNVDIIAIATAGAVNNENTKVLGSTGNLVEGYYTIDFQ